MLINLIVTRHAGYCQWVADHLPTDATATGWWVEMDGPRPVAIRATGPGYDGADVSDTGIRIPILTHVGPADVAGKHVIGVLPLSLAKHAASVTEVELPNLRPEQRGKELTPAEMDAAGAAFGTPLKVVAA